MEDIKYSEEELNSSQQGVAILYYMKKIFPGYHKIGFS
jgi:hypothetical protein